MSLIGCAAARKLLRVTSQLTFKMHAENSHYVTYRLHDVVEQWRLVDGLYWLAAHHGGCKRQRQQNGTENEKPSEMKSACVSRFYTRRSPET